MHISSLKAHMDLESKGLDMYAPVCMVWFAYVLIVPNVQVSNENAFPSMPHCLCQMSFSYMLVNTPVHSLLHHVYPQTCTLMGTHSTAWTPPSHTSSMVFWHLLLMLDLESTDSYAMLSEPSVASEPSLSRIGPGLGPRGHQPALSEAL